MKKLLFALLCLPLLCPAQEITESIISLNRTYKVWLQKGESNLAINFVKVYNAGKTDTTYQLIMDVSKTELVAEGHSLASAYFSGGIGIVDTDNYKYQERKSSKIMEVKEFGEFYNGMRSVYSHTSQQRMKDKESNTVARYKGKGVSFAGEYKEGIETFYFQLQDATFKMTKAQFEEIVKTIRAIKKRWKTDSLLP